MFPLGLTLIVLGLVVLPLVVLLFASFRPAGQLPFTGHTQTPAPYAEVFGSASTYHLRKNIFPYTAGMLAVSRSVAFTPARLTERTDLPGRGLLSTLMFVPMPMPYLRRGAEVDPDPRPECQHHQYLPPGSPGIRHLPRSAQDIYHAGDGVCHRHYCAAFHGVALVGAVP
jgi:hypothetical protein